MSLFVRSAKNSCKASLGTRRVCRWPKFFAPRVAVPADLCSTTVAGERWRCAFARSTRPNHGITMASVELLLTEPGRERTRVGWIDFYVLPARSENDLVCTPSGIVSFAEAQAISVELSQDVAHGRVGRYEWRRSRWWQSGPFRWLRWLTG